MDRQRPAANPYPQPGNQQSTNYMPPGQPPRSRPGEKFSSEQEYNMKFTSRQFHENDFVLPVCDREITPDEMILIRNAWAKSYRINEKCVEINFEPLNPEYYFGEKDKELLENYLMFCIDIKGNFDQTKSNSFKTDITSTRRCYSMLVPITERAKEMARKRKAMSSITSGTPLQTIYIGKPPEVTAMAPNGRKIEGVPKKMPRITQ